MYLSTRSGSGHRGTGLPYPQRTDSIASQRSIDRLTLWSVLDGEFRFRVANSVR
jgi:hypothetical protein